MNSLLYCTCLMVFGGVLSVPVPNKRWMQPCLESKNATRDPLFDLAVLKVNITPKNTSTDFEGLIISLSDLIEKSNEYNKQRMVRRMGNNKDVIPDLDSQPGLINFTSERSSGSGLITNITTLLTEDYERLSNLFIFVESSKLKRQENITEYVEETLLEQLEIKIVGILCKMSAWEISLPSGITREILIGNPTPSDHSDYVMIRDMVKVLDSIKREYETLNL